MPQFEECKLTNKLVTVMGSNSSGRRRIIYNFFSQTVQQVLSVVIEIAIKSKYVLAFYGIQSTISFSDQSFIM
ncbi:hypothetical protein BpHYR1_027380 [Brachionus plicatilis]|uniref:Uncharacterized protein n=1 Tax=Brachionus plicatilis TaxID=10195 RepID=A0A3M7RP99_BRAPC|nr:hypothetical protein BpHYR1_027380 [Brachionus plicatilis]